MINDIVSKIIPKVIEYRRHFHQFPELSFEEFETSEFVAEKLRELGYNVRTNIGGTGVMAVLDTGIPGPVIAFRADMDALPIMEESGLDFDSKRVGVMHACGHDGHMAILLGTAMLLMEIRDQLKGVIKLIFQPGEEANGGAKCIINDGALKNPDVEGVYALHMMPDIPTGTIAVKSGYMTATDDEFYIRVYGSDAHSSEPETGINAINIASQIVMGLNTIVSNNLSPFDVGTFSICKINGGEAINVIPDYVEMCGMIRCVEGKNKLMIRDKMTSIAENTAKGFGGSAEVEFIQGFPSVNNDARLTVNVIEAAEKSLTSKDDIIMIERPHLGSEDFAYYQEEVPGAIFMLGCSQEDSETGSLHSAILNINEDSFQYGVRIFGNIALDICGK
ncbi:MAG: amidohydrolase [Firmicutes bacterium]|nr:amidohydrolase [Bacillota bacterium]